MKKKTSKRMRRYFSAFLSLCIILMSFPGYAEEIESISYHVNFSFEAEAFLDSVSEITKGESRLDSEHIYWTSTEGSDLDANYGKLLNQPEVYEFFPEFTSADSMDGANVRTFIRTIGKNWKDGTYHVSGEEKLIFLFTNESGQDMMIDANVGSVKLPQMELSTWLEPMAPTEKPSVTETTAPTETSDGLKETEETSPSENTPETIPSEESEASTKDNTGLESTEETESAPTEESVTNEESIEEKVTEGEAATVPSEETQTPQTETSAAKETQPDTTKENVTKETPTEQESVPENIPAISLSSHYVPMVSESDERIGIMLEDDDLGTTDTTEDLLFTGKTLPLVMSEDGYSSMAFVTEFSQIITADSNTASPYHLNIQHLLTVDGVEYYEEQDVALNEDDFDQDGFYQLDNQVYHTPGITVVSSLEELIANKASFQVNEEGEYTLQTEIHYAVADGYQVHYETETRSELSPSNNVSQDAKNAASTEIVRIEGFPTLLPANSLELTAGHGTRYHFYTGMDYERSTSGIMDRMIDVSDIKTVYLFGGNINELSSLLIDSNVQDLTIVLGSDSKGYEKGLTLDARGTGYGAITVEPGANVTFTLVGDTTLYGDASHAGLELLNSEAETATVLINGEGSLRAAGGKGGAGIGGGTNAANGNLTITEGTITAVGGDGGAGIGGGNSNSSYKTKDRSGGTIVISGGEIEANGGESAAGIGGGNHGDGGNITIKGTSVVQANGGGSAAGIGSGLGSHKTENGKKGPGHYHGGVINISEDCRITAKGGGNGAGIGGGMYGDSGEITITGGTVDAYGFASTATNKLDYQGGAGIGGGYEGHANITITGGNVTAYAENSDFASNAAAGIGSGSTPNTRQDRGEKARGPEALYSETVVNIHGGNIEASGGSTGGAGIGSGFGADHCKIEITGGASTNDARTGGAGIGSGCNSRGIKDAYSSETQLDIAIKGGDITATGGWGASGIGSGASNIRAASVTIDSTSDITAYADGTKFAIDTYDRNSTDAPFVSRDGNSLFQGTFMDIGGDTNYEGLQVSLYKDLNADSGEQVIAPEKEPSERITLPDGYRSFARNAESEKNYLVKAGKHGFDTKWFVFEQIAANETAPVENDSQTYHYKTGDTSISDNYWLFLYKDGIVEEMPQEDPEPPETSAPPVIPEPPETSAPPVIPEPPETSAPPVIPEQPETSAPPVIPEQPETSAPPVIPEQPETSAPPEIPEQPTTPDSSNNDGSSDTGTSDNDNTQSNVTPTETPSETITIEPENVPLAALPPVSPDGSTTTIDDGQIPLAALPKTGERNAGMGLTSMVSGLIIGLYFILTGKKGKEGD